MEIIKKMFGKDKEHKDLEVEFMCEPELMNAIPEPIPANKVMPDWYKNLDMYPDDNPGMATVRACMPFLDALSSGWVIPIPADIQVFSANQKGGWTEFSSNASFSVVEHHSEEQVGDAPIPGAPSKFINHWSIKTPPGYSTLFLQPMNRMESRFQVFSGIVDTDNYTNNINFPFIWTKSGYDGMIERGTPMVQMIPFKRENTISDAICRTMTDDEQLKQKQTNNRIDSSNGYYRESNWESKKGTRISKEDE